MTEYERWLSVELDDPDLKEELLSVKDQPEEINDRFYRDLAFGTGGLRGVIGAGTNRMNVYTVRKATQGLANYLNKHNTEGKPLSVAIAHDSRNKGVLFSKESAAVLAANGIKAYLYPQLMPTPALSFAVRHLHCDAGICVTASHNPAKYNGYKKNALTRCVELIEGQIRKNKTRLEKRMKTSFAAAEAAMAVDSAPVPEEGEFEIRKKTFLMKPMTPEEAILQMNLLGHTFYVFEDAENGEMCVVYKRNAGSYGLIVPDKQKA